MEEFVEVGSIEGIKNGSVIKFEEGDIIVTCCRIVLGYIIPVLFVVLIFHKSAQS